MPWKDPAARSAYMSHYNRVRWAAMTEEEREASRRYQREWRSRRTEEQRAKEREYQRAYRLSHPKPKKERPPRIERTPKPRKKAMTPEEFAARPTDPRHGTPGGYTNYRCRCDPCRVAHAKQQRERRQRRARENPIDQA